MLHKAPVAAPAEAIAENTILQKGSVIASRKVASPPIMLELMSGSPMIDEHGKSFATNVSVVSGAKLNVYTQGGSERPCLFAWQNGLFGGATGDGHMRWVCFTDMDGDGAFEQAWRYRGSRDKKVAMPLHPPIPYQESSDNGAADFQTFRFERQIRVGAIKKGQATLELQEGMADRLSKVEEKVVDVTGQVNVQIGGLTVQLVGNGSEQITAKVIGELTPPNALLMCNGTRFGNENTYMETNVAFGPW